MRYEGARLSDVEIKRLPESLRQIVEVDRKFAEPVIELKAGKKLLERRAKLRRVAASNYGPRTGEAGKD